MFAVSDIRLSQLITHYIGNRALGDDLELSKESVDLSDDGLRNVLLHFLMTPFKDTASYHFYHSSDLSMNEIRQFAKAAFEDPSSLREQSIKIARHLHEVTNLPHIKSGELHVAYLEGCPVNGRLTDALVICKTETKESFLKLEQTSQGFVFAADEGINPNKMDKGCLILNVREEEGYQVHVIDKTNRGEAAQFWQDTFLQLRAAGDDYHHTNDYLKLCKDFIVEKIPEEFETTRVEQIDLLNKSVSYFKKNEQFDKASFEESVFQIPELIDSFRKYEQQYQEDYELEFQDGFGISDAAVKKQARVFKSVIKLDRNFHVYVHGNRELIEKGYDDQKGMHYYKIYFEEET